jgi:hypothetical protein
MLSPTNMQRCIFHNRYTFLMETADWAVRCQLAIQKYFECRRKINCLCFPLFSFTFAPCEEHIIGTMEVGGLVIAVRSNKKNKFYSFSVFSISNNWLFLARTALRQNKETLLTRIQIIGYSRDKLQHTKLSKKLARHQSSDSEILNIFPLLIIDHFKQ